MKYFESSQCGSQVSARILDITQFAKLRISHSIDHSIIKYRIFMKKAFTTIFAAATLLAFGVSVQAMLPATKNARPELQSRRPDFRAAPAAERMFQGRSAGSLRSYVLGAKSSTSSIGNAVKPYATSTAPLIYTAILNADSWGGTSQLGIYSFEPSAYGFTAIEQDNQKFYCNGGAGYIGDDTYWVSNISDFGGGQVWVEVAGYSTTDWSSIYSTYEFDASLCCTDMAYDEGSRKVYGCFYNSDNSGYEFGQFDADNATRNTICTLDKSWIACAFDAQGTLFAVDSDGELSKVDLSNGALTVIGQTGLTSQNMTSGTIDTATGIFYVATSNPSGSALYAVDTTTARASKLYDLTDNEELVGMYVVRHGSAVAEAVAPKAPTDLSVNFEQNQLTGTVTFTMPSEDIEGSALTGALDYEIAVNDEIAAKGQAEAGATVSKEITVAAAGNYNITVTAINGEARSEIATVAVEVNPEGVQGQITLPYYQDFSTGAPLFTFLDGNNDGVTWYYWQPYQNVYSGLNISGPADDYLVTPGVYLTPGNIYHFGVDIKQRGETDPEDIEILLGTAATVEALNTTIYGPETISDGLTHRPEIDVKVDRAGVYYFAVRIMSPQGRYGAYVDNVSISAPVNLKAPAAPTVKATPDANGKKEATVEVTAPATDLNGDALTLTKLEISRDGEVIRTEANPAPGQTFSFTDEFAESDYHTYSAVASNVYGTSPVGESKIYVGVNLPAPITRLQAMQTANPGEVKVTWDAPTTDIEGNPLNPDLITYIVGNKRRFENLKILGRGIKGTEYTFNFCDPETEQTFENFLVFPCTEKGNNDSDFILSVPTPVGKPYSLPFSETFGSEKSKYITTVSNSLSEWQLASEIYDQDGDDKYLFFACYSGHFGEIHTGIAGLDCEHPVFSFWYIAQEDGTDFFEVYANVDGAGFEKIDQFSINEGKHRDWTNHLTSLEKYKGHNVQMKIVYYSTGYRVAIDNMQIYDIDKVDLAISDFASPNMLRPGLEAAFSAKVTNFGALNSGRFRAELKRDGEIVNTAEYDGLEFNESKVITLTDTYNTASAVSAAYSINIVCDADINADNNATNESEIAVVNNDLPAPGKLAAEIIDGDVALSWTAPEIPAEDKIAVTDGAEDYVPFSIGMSHSEVTADYVGDWTMIDLDGSYTNVMAYGGSYLSYPNLAQKMAFMIFDHKKAQCPDYLYEYFEAHSGNQSFGCVGCMNGGTNNDWLISPMLSGRAQTITFYGKSPIVTYGRDTFQFLYSTTDLNPDNFILVGEEVNDAPALWTEYSFDVPEGAKYFAIRCTSENKYFLLIDDISFEAANPYKGLNVAGYNVYCNGRILNDAPVTATNFLHSDYDGKKASYVVTAVYNEGESPASNSVDVDLAGISESLADAGIRISVKDHTITIVNPSEKAVTVYDTLGRAIAGDSAARITVEAASGVYIVKSMGKSQKVVVR